MAWLVYWQTYIYSTKRWAGHAPKTSNHHCPCSYAGPKLRCCGTFSKLTGPVDEGTTMLFNLPASDGIIPSTQHLIYLLSSQPLNNYVCGRSDCKHCKCNYCDFNAVIALTVAAIFMVAAALAITTMVSAAVPTTVVTACTLGCGRDL